MVPRGRPPKDPDPDRGYVRPPRGTTLVTLVTLGVLIGGILVQWIQPVGLMELMELIGLITVSPHIRRSINGDAAAE